MSGEKDPFRFTKSIILDPENYDEIETVDMEASQDGSSQFEESSILGLLKHHPKERRKRSERVALYSLIGFLALMTFVMMRLKRSKYQETLVASGEKAGSILEINEAMNATKIYCSGRLSYSMHEWLSEDVSNSANLCDPEFQPERQEADLSKPVKVFLMMGEANMVGTGTTYGDVDGTLNYTVKTKKRFTHLIDYNKNWRTRSDVRYVAVDGDFNVQRNEWLSVRDESVGHYFFGPELQFGYILGELLDEPVLLLKACGGHHSLGGDMVPPGSERYEYGGYAYAGYGESPRRWAVGSEPTETEWYAGSVYDRHVENINLILQDIGKYYPRATQYEIAGIAFWHGDSDRRDSAYVSRYRSNLVFFINHLRADLNAPDAKVAIATLGQRGMEMTGDTLEVFNSQMAVGSLIRDFADNVITVDTRSSWRTEYLPGYEGDDTMKDVAHYGNNAETVMEVGNALGLAMAKLLHGKI